MIKISDLKMKNKLLLGNALSLSLVAILSFITYSTTSKLLKSSQLVDHTYVVIESAMDILAAAVDMETGMRGYLLAGKEDFLDPYKGGYASFLERVKKLKNTVSDNPAQVTLLEEIEANITSWRTDVTEPTIALRAEIGDAKTMDDMADVVGEARGKTYFDKFRGQIATFIERENTLLEKREQEAGQGAGSYDNQESSAKWVKHTQNVIKEAMRIEAAAVDMETGMRGFLLSGKESFLDPYTGGATRFYQKVDDLKKTVSDNSAQVTLLDEIKTNIENWQRDVTEPAISLRREIGDAKTMNDMAHLVSEARGKKYFDKFRGQVATFIEREETLMAVRKDESHGAASFAKSLILVGTLVIIIIALTVSMLISRAITKPVTQAVDLANAIAEGNMTKNLDISSKDEIGLLSSSLNKISSDLGGMIREIVTGVNTLSSSSTSLSAIASQLSSGAGEASSRSNNVATAAEEMSANMDSVSAAMEQSASNVGMVATATEEMSATVNEIAQNAERAKGISEQAVIQSEQTSGKINELGEAANRIGKVTETITEISEQTNLLALNATIEAARAGDAGKGFAVVANEIKDLAKQTADATVDIKSQIEGMQTTTDGTIVDIQKIGEVINDINDVITTIATAVEEQSAATSEISENVSQAAAGIAEVNENVAQSSVATSDITKDISDINTTSAEINKSSNNVQESSTELTALADKLGVLVKRFVV
ncbi:methyl-accepting chemotaxis protein [Desulfopila sp. IMCC35008]|uniref:CHASE3 domain-containing protein n=1 Tax=Desulfopila sp. IMCC35008 TaxID=2653858 RepID=UPI0013D4A684|nr:methyl-accepting chemotaxis protein [Desulfopila sp. IMCC35008]